MDLFCCIQTDCRVTVAGTDYSGHINKAKNGLSCQRWDSQTPHKHHYIDKEMFPEKNLTKAEDYCRNPDRLESGGPWCYTTNPNIRWAYCDVPMCGKQTWF